MNGELQIAVLSDRWASNCFESPNFLQILVESVNKRGFKIVEYYNSRHPDPHDTEESDASDSGMFRFEKTCCVPETDCTSAPEFFAYPDCFSRSFSFMPASR